MLGKAQANGPFLQRPASRLVVVAQISRSTFFAPDGPNRGQQFLGVLRYVSVLVASAEMNHTVT